jgi:Zn-dependent peptidase ImmA (M78 family)
VIRIDEGLPLPVQRYALIHELQHALVELLDVMIEKYPDHVRPKAYAEVRRDDQTEAGDGRN